MFEVERNRTENTNGDWEEYKCNQDKNQNKFKEYSNSSGYWWKSVSDINNNLLLHEDSDGVWQKLTYNENGHVLSYQDSTGVDVKYHYYGNYHDCLMTISKLPGKGYFTKEQFDSKEKKLINKITMTEHSVKTVTPDGEWEEYFYDENGEEISYKTSDGWLNNEKNT